MKNVGRKVLVVVLGIIVCIAIGVMIGYDMKTAQIKNTYPLENPQGLK